VICQEKPFWTCPKISAKGVLIGLALRLWTTAKTKFLQFFLMLGINPRLTYFFTTPQNQVSSLADDNIYDEEVQKNLYS